MVDVVLAIQTYAGWLYLLTGALVARELASLWRAWRARSTALFGLELEAATGRMIRSTVTLLLLATIGIGIVTVARVVAPSLPESARRAPSSAPFVIALPTAVFPTDTPSPPPSTPTRPLPLIVTATPGG